VSGGVGVDDVALRRMRWTIKTALGAIAVIALAYAEDRLIGSGHPHLARWYPWLALLAVVAVGVNADRITQRRREHPFPLGVAVADAFLIVIGSAAVTILAFGGPGAVLGLALFLVLGPVWVARIRALSGHWDGPALLSLFLGLLTYEVAGRPFAHSADQWNAVTAAAAAGLLLALASLVQAITNNH
jgi:hypothetical protein